LNRDERRARADAILAKPPSDWTQADDAFMVDCASSSINKRNVREMLSRIHGIQGALDTKVGHPHLMQLRAVLIQHHQYHERKLTFRGFWLGIRTRLMGQEVTIGGGVDEIEETAR
jgi:hypothetical protein